MAVEHEPMILRPDHLWSAAEVLTRPSPVPAEPGVYGWYFDEVPGDFDTTDCRVFRGMPLLYVGIAPARPPSNGKPPSRKNLRTRLRSHYRGNADASTLRMTLGCLLSERLRMRLIRTAGGRFRFCPEAERDLSQWMAEHAFVTWTVHPMPWIVEDELIASVSLPLNLKGNQKHANWRPLTAARAAARELARGR
jgi:hypothetical protein